MFWINHIKQNMSSRICLIGSCWKSQSPPLPQSNMESKSMSLCVETTHQENWPRKARNLWIRDKLVTWRHVHLNWICCQSFLALLVFLPGALLRQIPTGCRQVIHNVRKNNIRAPSAWGYSNNLKCDGNLKYCLKFYSIHCRSSNWTWDREFIAKPPLQCFTIE